MPFSLGTVLRKSVGSHTCLGGRTGCAWGPWEGTRGVRGDTYQPQTTRPLKQDLYSAQMMKGRFCPPCCVVRGPSSLGRSLGVLVPDTPAPPEQQRTQSTPQPESAPDFQKPWQRALPCENTDPPRPPRARSLSADPKQELSDTC